MSNEVLGRCRDNAKGVLELNDRHPNPVPAIKRHAKQIRNNKERKILFSTACQASKKMNVPLNQIIERA
ncbi:hypothetical protein FZC76_22090 [Sutcliffiella horikoshii]|uniref:Uncharacterized protein n=1 Tax=Sutcliffiella horikoshii TaxID=79883 RepID=A0A5D4SBM4_9BACI|nr:hypothetical protein [Sutcliffiella horikoshii]TYS59524.1 hypothetical protein FZC76_22090 [Sutcliffiella horikoshii]